MRETRNVYKNVCREFFLEKVTWKDNIKEVGRENGRMMEVAQNDVHQQGLVLAVSILQALLQECWFVI
jgi:hypothetical protein